MGVRVAWMTLRLRYRPKCRGFSVEASWRETSLPIEYARGMGHPSSCAA
jgi:hypothetical protein